MKLPLAVLASACCGAAANRPTPMGDITADSVLGRTLILQARNLDQSATDITWVAGYSIKFQGCHSVQQWNPDVNEANDVRLKAKNLVRFRLCPTSTCSASTGAGCSGGYGDYIIDMTTFLDAYYVAKTNAETLACQSHTCDCSGADNQDYCLYDCYLAAGMSYCSDTNPYTGKSTSQIDVQNYLDCAQYKNRRRLAANDVQYFIGPYCSEQGGSIFMGMFTDDSCSEHADDYFGVTTFQTMTGATLPYGDTSLVGSDCLSCLGSSDGSGASVGEQCATIYAIAGKCESSLPQGMTSYPNTNGCNYMEGIKITRKDGIIISSASRPSPVTSSFIVIFAMTCAALLFYVWYLRRRLGTKKDQLL